MYRFISAVGIAILLALTSAMGIVSISSYSHDAALSKSAAQGDLIFGIIMLVAFFGIIVVGAIEFVEHFEGCLQEALHEFFEPDDEEGGENQFRPSPETA